MSKLQNRSPDRTADRWEVNIKQDLQEKGYTIIIIKV